MLQSKVSTSSIIFIFNNASMPKGDRSAFLANKNDGQLIPLHRLALCSSARLKLRYRDIILYEL